MSALVFDPLWIEPDKIFEKQVMLCVWWNTREIVHFKILKSSFTIGSKLYCQQLEKVNHKLIQLGIDSLKIKLLHDNSWPHVSKMT